MRFIARVFIGAGGSWARGETTTVAADNVLRIAKQDWSGLFDVEQAIRDGQLEIHLYEDGGTDSFDDDTFIKTITA